MAQYLTPHFTLEEFQRSKTARILQVDNIAPLDAVINIRTLCESVLEPLREHIGKPVMITSGYRCPELNKAIGGAEKSQHMKGQAADIVVKGMTVQELAEAIMASAPGFDQLILEPSWVHVSWRSADKNRNQVLDLQKKWEKK